eukprot:g36369.t1
MEGKKPPQLTEFYKKSYFRYREVKMQLFNSVFTEGAESDCLTDSTSHSLSPISSIDSYRFSPPYLAVESPRESHEARSLPSPPTERPDSGQGLRKTRPRYPGRQRQSASEREKLRMRGLAKALHNLRT